MPGRIVQIVDGEYYHVYNRGVEKRNIFLLPRDYKRFLQTTYYYQYKGPKPKLSILSKQSFSTFNPKPEHALVDIICYCLMPNHFHFLLRQKQEKGVAIFVSQLSNSYTKYFNTKHNRTGALFQGVFKAAHVSSDEQYLHVSRYIHLNPLIAKVSPELDSYRWSSWGEYVHQKSGFCVPEDILELVGSREQYRKFVEDQVDYAQSLAYILKRKLLEEDDV